MKILVVDDHVLIGEALHSEDPRASPLRSDKLAGLARAVICTAEFDPLRDEGEANADAMERAGGVQGDAEPGLKHIPSG